MKLRLHTRAQNSAGQRVRIVLNLKGVPYEYVAIPSLSSEAYRALNPQGLMPALEIDGRVVAQSMAIIELIEELFPEPSVLPGNPILRAEARSFAQLIAADLHPINNQRVRRYLAEVIGADPKQVLAWYRHWVAKTFASLEAMLARRAVAVTLLLRGPAGACRGLPHAAGRQRPPVRLRPVALSVARGHRRRMPGARGVRPGCARHATGLPRSVVAPPPVLRSSPNRPAAALPGIVLDRRSAPALSCDCNKNQTVK